MGNILSKHLDNGDLGRLLLRLAVGIVFINAGWKKIEGIDMVVGFFGSLGFSAWLAYLVAYVEFIGGLVILLGVHARYSALVLAAIMLVATIKVHLPNGYSLQAGGYEYTLLLLLVAGAIATLGEGKYSFSGLLGRSRKAVPDQVA